MPTHRGTVSNVDEGYTPPARINSNVTVWAV